MSKMMMTADLMDRILAEANIAKYTYTVSESEIFSRLYLKMM